MLHISERELEFRNSDHDSMSIHYLLSVAGHEPVFCILTMTPSVSMSICSASQVIRSLDNELSLSISDFHFSDNGLALRISDHVFLGK